MGAPHAPPSRRRHAQLQGRPQAGRRVRRRRSDRHLQAVWKVKEQLRALLRTGSLEDAATAKEHLEELVKAAARPETNRLYRTVCRWWQEIEVLIITGATTGKVEANNTAIKNIKRTARGYRNPSNYKSVILLRSAVRTAA
ncbi:transposase [Pseudarthrobacter sp. J47]|uniref:transposase n=1 Tax=Pseudarthrobacter sp. J47 TaxID=3116482 RepID=UPI003CC58069